MGAREGSGTVRRDEQEAVLEETYYYLNALAGNRRSMASSDDPELAWIRPAWKAIEPDPRVPPVT